MLLAEFLNVAGIVDGDVRTPMDLNVVERFTFGERYLIERRGGATYDVPDLDVMLSIIHDEYKVWRRQMIPMMAIDSIRKQPASKLAGVDRVLTITSAAPNGFVPPPPLDAIVQKVKIAVTMYNLTGTWEQFNNTKGNL